MKSKLPVALLVVLLLAETALTAKPKPSDASDADFQSHEYTHADGKTLPYRLLKLAGYDTAKGPSPLLILLHGAGERGADNCLQLVHGKPLMRCAAATRPWPSISPRFPSGPSTATKTP